MELGKNIAKYRKEKDMTQKNLADLLGVSFQAVSKWETGRSLPDLFLIPKLAAILNVSCDMLLSYYPAYSSSPYEELYQSDAYYWGILPTALSMKVLSHYPPKNGPILLDVGCREGQNVLFFGRNGYRVTGVDMSEAGIRKARLLTDKWHVPAMLICASIEGYRPSRCFHILFCDNMLHLVTPENREQLLSCCKDLTLSGGVHVIKVPVKKPFQSQTGSLQKSYPWFSGQLLSLYWDWEILEGGETAFPSETNPGTAETCNYLVAKKPFPPGKAPARS